VWPAADSTTLAFRARDDNTFTISLGDTPRVIGVARVGDTTTATGVSFAVSPSARGLSEFRLRIDRRETAIDRFQSNVKISRPARDVDLISIVARSGDPAQAAEIANMLARDLIANRQDARQGRTGSAVAFLKKQDDSLRRQLRDAEEKLRAYRQREHVVDGPEQARTQVSRLAQLQVEIAGVRAERDGFAKLMGQMLQDTTGESLGGQTPSRRLIGFPSLLRNQSASALLGALAQVETERSELLIRRVHGDSDVQVLTRRIRDIESQIQGIAESYVQGLTSQLTSLESEASRTGSQLDALPRTELEVARRERDARVLTELSVLVRTRLKEAEITGAAGDPNVRLAGAAALPTVPIRPRPLINLALSLLMGSLVGITSAVTLDYRDRSIRSRADALSASGLPVLGAIPQFESHSPSQSLPRSRRRRRRSRRARPLLLAAGQPAPRPSADGIAAAAIASRLVNRSSAPLAYVEAFIQLTVNLAIAFEDRPAKVMVVTSPLPSEGKTLTVANLALTVAAQGPRVLLIDADVRCGLIGDVFHSDRQPGFAELLAGTAEFHDVAHHIPLGEDTELVVVPAGDVMPVASRFHGMSRVRDVLEAVSPRFDLVLIDTPPTNLLSDAAVLGSAADAVLLVMRVGQTRVEAVRYAMDRLNAARAPAIGTLLNDIDLRRYGSDDGSYHYIAEVERYYAGRR